MTEWRARAVVLARGLRGRTAGTVRGVSAMGDGDGGGEGCLSVEVWVVIEITGHTPDQAGRGDP